jgi:hypothetical protein
MKAANVVIYLALLLVACSTEQQILPWKDLGRVKLGPDSSTILVAVPVRCRSTQPSAAAGTVVRICRYAAKEVYSVEQRSTRGIYIEVLESISSNCTAGTMRSGDVTYYGVDGRVVSVDRSRAAWRPVLKRGMDERMQDFVCKSM